MLPCAPLSGKRRRKMKQNPDFILSDVAGDHILVPIGKTSLNFHGLITMNEMGKTIWNLLENEITLEQLLQKILAEYDVSADQARGDIENFVSKLRENGCIEV